MDTIRKTVEVNYHKLSINDIITMIPKMDEMAAEYRTFNKWISDKQKGIDKDSTPIEVYVNKANKLYEQLCILTKLGFSTSNNNRDIEPPQQINI